MVSESDSFNVGLQSRPGNRRKSRPAEASLIRSKPGCFAWAEL
jgi:hypothetical protein